MAGRAHLGVENCRRVCKSAPSGAARSCGARQVGVHAHHYQTMLLLNAWRRKHKGRKNALQQLSPAASGAFVLVSPGRVVCAASRVDGCTSLGLS